MWILYNLNKITKLKLRGSAKAIIEKNEIAFQKIKPKQGVGLEIETSVRKLNIYQVIR